MDHRMQRLCRWLAQLGATEMWMSDLELTFDIREGETLQAEFLESIRRCQRAHGKAFCIGEAKANWVGRGSTWRGGPGRGGPGRVGTGGDAVGVGRGGWRGSTRG